MKIGHSAVQNGSLTVDVGQNMMCHILTVTFSPLVKWVGEDLENKLAQEQAWRCHISLQQLLMNSICFTRLVIMCAAISVQSEQAAGKCTFSFFTLSKAKKLFVVSKWFA